MSDGMSLSALAAEVKAAAEAKAKLEAQVADALADKEEALAAARTAPDVGVKAASEGRAAGAEQLAVAYKQKLAQAQTKLAELEAKLKQARASATKHVVAAGETLSDLSLKYYKSANKWQGIYDANKDVIGDNPNVIKPGMELVIPDA